VCGPRLLVIRMSAVPLEDLLVIYLSGPAGSGGSSGLRLSAVAVSWPTTLRFPAARGRDDEADRVQAVHPWRSGVSDDVFLVALRARAGGG
jgi:hypothetical protein